MSAPIQCLGTKTTLVMTQHSITSRCWQIRRVYSHPPQHINRATILSMERVLPWVGQSRGRSSQKKRWEDMFQLNGKSSEALRPVRLDHIGQPFLPVSACAQTYVLGTDRLGMDIGQGASLPCRAVQSSAQLFLALNWVCESYQLLS